MAFEPGKRPRRTPLSSEDVAHVIAVKRWREFKKLQRFKRSGHFKLLNLFNVLCIFVYFELLFCYFGPCHYQVHYSAKRTARYGYFYTPAGRPVVADIDVHGVDGHVYTYIIDDFIDLPPQRFRFTIGKDFLLQKKLKGTIENLDGDYRLFSASPVLFLCMFVIAIFLFAFSFDMNQKAYSLNALTVLNVLTFTGILCL